MAPRAGGRKPKGRERWPLGPWLPVAAAAHAALLVLALSAKEAPPLRSPAPADAVTDPTWLELIAAETAEELPDREAGPAPSAAPPEGDALVAPRPPARLGRVPRHERSDRDAVASVRSRATRDVGDEPANAGPAAPGVGGVEGDAPGPDSARPSLSLRDLGVDRGSNPFIGSPTELPTARQLYNQRLRQSLRQGIAQQDQARGLGPEGPAVTAVTDIVMASATAPNTTALLRVRTDGAGAVTRVDVLEADRDGAEWQRIADELVRALAGRRLRVPAGGNGVSFQLRVISRVQLPSGADPGLAIDVLGIPVKKGEGKRSTKLSILSPMVTEIEVPNSNGLRVPVVAFSLLGGMGDPTDIGAVARRLVTAYLVAMDTDAMPANAAPPAPPPAPAATP